MTTAFSVSVFSDNNMDDFWVYTDWNHYLPNDLPIYRAEGSLEVNEIEVFDAMFLGFLDDLSSYEYTVYHAL